MEGTNSRLCRYCEIGWPFLAEYVHCPQCAEPTRGSYLAGTVSSQEARRLTLHAEFGWRLLREWLTS